MKGQSGNAALAFFSLRYQILCLWAWTMSSFQHHSTGSDVRSQKAFTLIEFVVALIILGIISVFAMSRILRNDTIDALVLRDQIVSITRNAQQTSLGRNDVELSITPDGVGSVEIKSTYDSGAEIIDSIVFEIDSISLTGDVNVTTSCSVSTGSVISNANPFYIRFGELGNLEDSGFGAGTTVVSSLRICLNNSAIDSVCVSPSGFAYAGDCDV